MVSKLHHVRIAASYRQRDLVAIIAAGGFEDSEWVDEDLADLTVVDVPEETVNVTNNIARH